MLSARDNKILTSVGPGTLMGNLLRRYWTPACLSAELPDPDDPPVRVRLLGENLVAFRDTNGKVGLVAENCPHRGASVFFGRNEECGLRCVYHGWKFDVDGNCVETPNEPTERNLKNRVKIGAYPTHESGGIVWTYMGPTETMTPFRDFGTESLPVEHVVASKLHSPCNWVQSMEGNIDPSHISWLHQFNGIDDIPDDGSDKPGYPSNGMSWKLWRHDRAPRLDVHRDWYGFRCAAIRTTPNGHTHVRITAYVVPYSTMVANNPFTTRQGMFVPIDDENCWRYGFSNETPSNPHNYGGDPLLAMNTPYRAVQFWGRVRGTWPWPSGILPREYTLENDYKIDRDAQHTLNFTGIDNRSQDFMVTETMGPIYNRTQEHLGAADKPIIAMRQILLDAAKGLAQGKEPPAIGDHHDYRSIRGAEKILEPGEAWRVLGTVDDPTVQEAQLAIKPSTDRQGEGGGQTGKAADGRASERS